jgi:hypothetical protein
MQACTVSREKHQCSHDVNGKRYRYESIFERKGRGEGRVVINHTNTTGCHVSSNHDWALASLELVQDPITFVLLFVAMDSFLKTSVTRIRLRYRGGTLQSAGQPS